MKRYTLHDRTRDHWNRPTEFWIEDAGGEFVFYADVAAIEKERDELKALVEKNEGRVKEIVDESLLRRVERIENERDELRVQCNRHVDTIHDLAIERDTLKAENERLRAELQRRSFAFGNAAVDNPDVTREVVDEEAEKEQPK